MPRYFICRRRATWLPKPGELVYHAPPSSLADLQNPTVLEYEVVCEERSRFPGVHIFHVKHRGIPSMSDGRYSIDELFQTPQEALLWRKYRLLEAVEKFDIAILEATRIHSHEQSLAVQRPACTEQKSENRTPVGHEENVSGVPAAQNAG